MRSCVPAVLTGALTCAAAAAPGDAQTRVDANLAIANDDVFRGRSQSDGRPVGQLTLALENTKGLYAGLTGSALVSHGGGIEPLGVLEYGGYASRLSARYTLDVGVVNMNYSSYRSDHHTRGYVEVYAGLLGPGYAAHLRLSPNYFAQGRVTAYGEADAVPFQRGPWSLTVHGGLLIELARPADTGGRRLGNSFDWRTGIARRFGQFRLEGALAGAGPEADGTRGHHRAIVRLSVDL